MSKPTKKTQPLSHEELVEARDRLFELRDVQVEARDEELRIRTYLADNLHDGEKGSKTIAVDGIKITIGRPLSYSIDSANAEKFTQENSEAALEVLSWKPTVKVSGFNKFVEIASEYITVRPGPPTVDFK